MSDLITFLKTEFEEVNQPVEYPDIPVEARVEARRNPPIPAPRTESKLSNHRDASSSMEPKKEESRDQNNNQFEIQADVHIDHEVNEEQGKIEVVVAGHEAKDNLMAELKSKLAKGGFLDHIKKMAVEQIEEKSDQVQVNEAQVNSEMPEPAATSEIKFKTPEPEGIQAYTSDEIKDPSLMPEPNEDEKQNDITLKSGKPEEIQAYISDEIKDPSLMPESNQSELVKPEQEEALVSNPQPTLANGLEHTSQQALPRPLGRSQSSNPSSQTSSKYDSLARKNKATSPSTANGRVVFHRTTSTLPNFHGLSALKVESPVTRSKVHELLDLWNAKGPITQKGPEN